MNEKFSKIYLDKKQLTVCAAFLAWAACTRLFSEQLLDMFDGFDSFLPAMFLGGLLLLGPFVAAATSFGDAFEIALKDPRLKNSRVWVLILGVSFVVFFLQFLMLESVRGYGDALLYNLYNPKFFKLAFIAYIAWGFTKSYAKNPFQTGQVAYWFSIAMYLWALYFSYGLDDGCTTVGGDPLFGGGGYEECGGDYQKQKDLNSELASESNYTSSSLFATEMLIAQLTGFLAIFVGKRLQ